MNSARTNKAALDLASFACVRPNLLGRLTLLLGKFFEGAHIIAPNEFYQFD